VNENIGSYLKDKFRKFWKITSGLGLVSIGSFVSLGLLGLLWIILASVMDVSSYGTIAFSISIGAILSTVFTLGGNTTLTTSIAGRENRIISTIHGIVLFAILPSNILVYFLLNDVFLNLFFTSLMLSLLSEGIVLGKRNYKNYATYLIFQKAAVLILSLVVFGLIGPKGVILGYAIANFGFSFPLLLSIKNYGVSFFNIKKIFVRMTHGYSLEISRISSMFLDKIFIAPIFGMVMLGYYQLSSQILLFLGMIPLVFYNFNLTEESRTKVPSSLKKKVLIFSAFVTIVYIFSAPFIIQNLFPKFEESITASQILSLGIVPMALSYNAQSSLLARKKGKHVLIGSIILVTVELSMLYLLGITFDLEGLSFAVLIALITQAFYYIGISYRLKDVGSVL